jgi:hypothetical protein
MYISDPSTFQQVKAFDDPVLDVLADYLKTPTMPKLKCILFSNVVKCQHKIIVKVPKRKTTIINQITEDKIR